ncbi:MAG: carboxypeptidase regulatory-like domain-containing protein [Ahniella sp.]|nr:carboxypeptidase regulatory-like domain-containing protein [Ahniella sp.]
MSGVTLQLLDNRGAVVASRTTSATGTYVFSGLAGSTYALVSRGTPGFVDLAWPNVACPQSCNGLNGTPIAVVTGGSATGIDLSLSSGGEISGTVRNSATNLPIPGAAVQVYNSSAIPVNQIATNASGNYALGNLADGSYYVRTQNSLGFVNEVFVDRNCGGYCDMLAGDAVAISGGAPVGLVDFSLDAGGSISGRLTSAVSGAGIALAEVQALDVNGLIASRTSTNATGQFTLGGLQPGTYKVRTSNTAGFVNQIYRTPTVLSCSPSPCLLSAGTGISVTGAVSNIDMALSPGGTISGTAADLFNNPLPTGVAILLDSNGIEVMSVTINNGLFEFNGLANGSYYVLIRNSSGLVDLLYPNAPCPAGACNITASGTPIVLSGTRQAGVNSAFASVDLRLPEGREISGQVTRGGLPFAGVTVSIYNTSGSVVATGVTDALGRYETTGGLPAGAGISYFAATTSPSTRGAADGSINEAWNNVPCMLNCGVAQVGTAIPLPAAVAPLANINFDLAAGGAVSGRVQSSLGDDLSLVRVELYDAGGKLVGTADTNSSAITGSMAWHRERTSPAP